MKRPVLLSLVSLVPLLALAAACGSDTAAIDAGGAPTITTPPTPPVEDAPVSDQSTVTTTIYLASGSALVPAGRQVPDTGDLEAAAADALRALLSGPTAAERAAGLSSEIPVGTRLLGLDIGDDRIATVDLSGEFETGGGSASMQTRLAQLACTVDDVVALDLADGMLLQLDGRPVEVFSGEGIILDGPVSCSDFSPRLEAGEPARGCIDGWTSPQAGDPLRKEALDLLRISLGTQDKFVVEDIRYFTGPDSPGILQPARDSVERWYVKARLADDPSVRGRFVVVRRGGSGGVEAVAPYSTSGYESPGWAAFEGEGDPVAYPDLPGRWSGIRYDFVTGEGGPGQPGLPAEVVACLAGT